MQMYKTFVGINCHCFNHISQGDYYLNLEKDVSDIKNRFDTFNRLMELNKSLPRNRNKKDEYNKKHNKQKTSTFNSKNKPIRDNKLIRRLTIKEIEKISGMSKSDYYRKKKESYGKGTTYWTNYKKNSTKPHRVRQSKINLQTRSVVLKIRQKHQLYSKAKIKAIIDREYPDIGKKISESSIGRLLKEFSKKGLIKLGISKNKKKNKDKNNQEDKRKRNFERTHSQAWNFEEHFIGEPKIRTETDRKKHEKHKIKNKTEIGKLIEMDHLKCERNGIKFVQFSAIDPCTRILVSKIYPTANSKNARDFLLHTIKQFPFKIKSIQVDGGSEFRKYFEEECKKQNIPLFVLPPYSPKYNGRVERSNRTIREDFYSEHNTQIDYCITTKELNYELQKYIQEYNTFRPHQALAFKTPMEYYNYQKVGMS